MMLLFMSQARVTVKGLRRHMTVKMLRDSGSHNQKDLAAIASSAMDGKESGGSTKSTNLMISSFSVFRRIQSALVRATGRGPKI